MINLGLILVLIGGLVLTVGDIFMKQWTYSNSWVTFIIGLLTWCIGLVFLAFSFKYKNIAVGSLIFSLSNVIFLTIFSWLYYKEMLTTYQIIGMILGIIAVIFLEL
jgi:multidrug transporter EmrE-like cation transporter